MVFPTFAAFTCAFGRVYNGDETSSREALQIIPVREQVLVRGESLLYHGSCLKNSSSGRRRREIFAVCRLSMPSRGLCILQPSLSKPVAATVVSWITRSLHLRPRPLPMSPRTHTLFVMAHASAPWTMESQLPQAKRSPSWRNGARSYEWSEAIWDSSRAPFTSALAVDSAWHQGSIQSS